MFQILTPLYIFYICTAYELIIIYALYKVCDLLMQRHFKKLPSKVKWCRVWCNTGAKRPPSHSLHYLCHTHASAQIFFNILSQSRLRQTMLLNNFLKVFNSLGYLSPLLRPPLLLVAADEIFPPWSYRQHTLHSTSPARSNQPPQTSACSVSFSLELQPLPSGVWGHTHIHAPTAAHSPSSPIYRSATN